jgi:hypothetical protein
MGSCSVAYRTVRVILFVSVDLYAGDIVRDVNGRYRSLYILVSVVRGGTVRVVRSGLVVVRGLWVEGGEVAALYGIKCNIRSGKRLAVRVFFG